MAASPCDLRRTRRRPLAGLSRQPPASRGAHQREEGLMSDDLLRSVVKERQELAADLETARKELKRVGEAYHRAAQQAKRYRHRAKEAEAAPLNKKVAQ